MCLVNRYKDACRFTKYVKIDKHGCWIWQGHKDKDGYGGSCLDGKGQRANRVSYQIFNGPIVDGLLVCHSCDNPECVNPKHLWLGTHRDNRKDAAQKNRLNLPTGDQHWSRRFPEKRARGNRNGSCTKPESRPKGDSHVKSKLTSVVVFQLRSLRKQGAKLKELSRRFGISQGRISDIVNNKGWKHISFSG